jgi:hypothetical protein
MAYTCASTGGKPIISAIEKGGVMAVSTPPGDFPRRTRAGAIAEPFTAGCPESPWGCLPDSIDADHKEVRMRTVTILTALQRLFPRQVLPLLVVLSL